MRNRHRIISLFLSVLLVFSMFFLPAAAEESGVVFGADGMSRSGSTLPGNLRLLIGEPKSESNPDGTYSFGKLRSKYNFLKDYMPDTTGMSTLYISGSREYSVSEFKALADEIRRIAPEQIKDVYIFDLRQETHGFVTGTGDDGAAYDGYAVSVYDEHNWCNMGMSTEEVMKAEKEMLHSRSAITLRSRQHRSHETTYKTIQVKEFITEEELVSSVNSPSDPFTFHYIRYAIPDRTFPEEDIIDAFIEFVKSIDMDAAWLHFHCLAGMGRTGIMMSIYDMMKNPEVSMMDILVRHAMTGSSYSLSDSQTESWLRPYTDNRLRLVPLIYEYIQDNYRDNYPVSWSEWLRLYDGKAS